MKATVNGDNNMNRPVLTVASHEVPLPRSLSDGARAALEASDAAPRVGFPEVDDAEGWRAAIERQRATEAGFLDSTTTEQLAGTFAVKLDQKTVADIPVAIGTPNTWDRHDPRVVLSLHGGGWIQGGGGMVPVLALMDAASLGMRSWAVDYRMPPEHRFPAHLDDCLAVYRAMLEEHDPQSIAVSGTSAGANLAAALMLRARDEGLPLPAAVAMWTPAVDLTGDGDTWHTLAGLDPIIGPHMSTLMDYYARGQDPRHPYLSPIFGDLSAFPPTVLISGTRDGLLSDTVRFHRALRRAGRHAELHVFEAMPHGGFDFVSPEDQERGAEIRAFFDARLRH